MLWGSYYIPSYWPRCWAKLKKGDGRFQICYSLKAQKSVNFMIQFPFECIEDARTWCFREIYGCEYSFSCGKRQACWRRRPIGCQENQWTNVSGGESIYQSLFEVKWPDHAACLFTKLVGTILSRHYGGKNIGNAADVKKQLSLVAEAVLSAADIIRPVVSSKQRGKKNVSWNWRTRSDVCST